jgi:uridine kinase
MMNTFHQRTFIVGMGGPSCAGKTSVAEKVAAKLAGRVLSMDSYYHDLSHLTLAERTKQNFDLPESIDSALLQAHVLHYAAGHNVNRPVYDFATHTRIPNRTVLMPWTPVLIVEGMLVLHWPELRRHFDLSVYLDAPDDVCFHRRKVRDIVERQRSQDFIQKQYETTVRPMAKQYVLPTHAFASVVLSGQKAPDVVVTELADAIRAKIEQKLDEL